jgi:hypothetical protein
MGCNISSYLVANFGFLFTYGWYSGTLEASLSSSSKWLELLFLFDEEKLWSSHSLVHEDGEGGSDIVDIGEVGGGEEHVEEEDDDVIVDDAGDNVKEDSSEKLRDLSSTK